MGKRAADDDSDDGMGWPAKKGSPDKPKKTDTGKVKRTSDSGKTKRPKDAAKGSSARGDTGKHSAVKKSDTAKTKRASGVRKAPDADEGGDEGPMSASARRRKAAAEKPPQSKVPLAIFLVCFVGLAGFLIFGMKHGHDEGEKKHTVTPTPDVVKAQHDAKKVTEAPPPAPATEAPKPAPSTEPPKPAEKMPETTARPTTDAGAPKSE